LPANCGQVSAWYEKEKSDSENIDWIKANTKPCPKCKSPIAKTQGCNHMQCSQCRADFCWLCLGEWKSHGSATGGYYSCNVYEKKKETDKDFAAWENDAAQARSEMQRYIFHYERYNNHGKSAKLCSKQIEKIRDQMQQLHEIKQYPQDELKFFEETSDIVIKCRNILRWSYVCVFFMAAKTQQEKAEKELFEYQQTTLEEACERTHQMLECDKTKFLDISDPDRSPFYQYKGNMQTAKESLHK